MTERRRVITLFDSLGGLRTGLTRAGLRVDYPRYISIHGLRTKLRQNVGRSAERLAQIEAEEAVRAKSATQTLAHPLLWDRELSNLAATAPEIARAKPAIIAGSPPHLRFRSGRDPDNFLLENFAIIVATSRPTYFVMENNISVAKSAFFEELFDEMLRNCGYGLTQMIVRVAEYGVADRRRRFICAGCLGAPDNWLRPYLIQYRTPRPLTVADILGPDFGVTLSECMAEEGEARQVASHMTREPGSVETVLRKLDHRTIDQLKPHTRLYFCHPSGRDTGLVHRTDRPAPSLLRTSLRPLSASYRPAVGDKVDLRLLPQPTLDDYRRLAGFQSEKTPENLASGSPQDDYSEFQQRVILAEATPPPLAEAIGRAIIDHKENMKPGGAHSKAHVFLGAEVPEPAAVRSPKMLSERTIERYRAHLKKEKRFKARLVSQLITDLKAAKAQVAQFELDNARAERKALERVFELKGKTSDDTERVRRSQKRRALRLFAEWEYEQSPEYKQILREKEEARENAEIAEMDWGDPDEGSGISPGLFERLRRKPGAEPDSS